MYTSDPPAPHTSTWCNPSLIKHVLLLLFILHIGHNGSLAYIVILFVYSLLYGCVSDSLTVIKYDVGLSVIGIMAQL
jgi:hypothetical protein